MLDPNQNISVTLSAMQWNLVLEQLDNGPHRMVRPLIDSVRQQCMANDPEAQLNPPTPLRAVPDIAGE